jgi:hypothetical protein
VSAVTEAGDYRALGETAWRWVLDQVRGSDGPWLPDTVGDKPPAGPAADRDSLYAGIAGLAPVLAELAHARALTPEEVSLRDAIAERLAAEVPTREDASLYDGLAGDVTALRLLAPGRERPALRRIADLATPTGWAPSPGSGATVPTSDITTGAAGVVLAATWAGSDAAEEIMTVGGEALLGAAEPTDAGLDWRMWPGYRSSMPNFSHGTAGVGATLAVTGAALGRDDFVAAALKGAQDVLAACTRCSRAGCPRGCAPASGTTTVAAAARRASATRSWTRTRIWRNPITCAAP